MYENIYIGQIWISYILYIKYREPIRIENLFIAFGHAILINLIIPFGKWDTNIFVADLIKCV